MVELTLVLPVLLLVLFAIVQFGMAFKDYLALTDGVRAGARKAVVSRTAADPVGEAVSAVERSSDLGDELDVDVTPGPWDPGQDVTVSATYPYEISLLGIVVQSGRLRSETTERVEP
jgi:hypothetical protein